MGKSIMDRSSLLRTSLKRIFHMGEQIPPGDNCTLITSQQDLR